MTLYEFNALSEEEQYEAVWDQGSFLLTRQLGKLRLGLYAMGTFFIEVRYCAQQNQILGWRSFRSTIALEPYLTQIDMHQLYGYRAD